MRLQLSWHKKQLEIRRVSFSVAHQHVIYPLVCIVYLKPPNLKLIQRNSPIEISTLIENKFQGVGSHMLMYAHQRKCLQNMVVIYFLVSKDTPGIHVLPEYKHLFTCEASLTLKSNLHG